MPWEALVLIFTLVRHTAPLFCSGHWHNYFLQLGWQYRPVLSLSFLDVYGFKPNAEINGLKLK
jgi:hypothetical protein